MFYGFLLTLDHHSVLLCHNVYDEIVRPELQDTGYYQALIHFPVLSGRRTFDSCSFCFILLYYHNSMCEMHLELPELDVAPIIIRLIKMAPNDLK